MNRLIENTVFSGFVTACRFATCPTSRSPDLVNATTDGVSRPPSGLVMTTGSPPSMTATTELVVPRSMPMILLIDSLENSLRDDTSVSIKLECHAFNSGSYTEPASVCYLLLGEAMQVFLLTRRIWRSALSWRGGVGLGL